MMAAAAVLASCGSPATPEAVIPDIILETDIGNDVDDAIAVDLAYKLVEAGKMNLLAICINKEGTAPAEYTDILNTWYGHPETPIGIIREGADCEADAVNYAAAVVEMKDEAGEPLFERSLAGYDALPEAPELYRKILSSKEDNSVTIVSIGFSTNLIRLLATGPDQYSELDGKALVAAKVKNLVMMAGDFSGSGHHEYNVVKDIPAAQTIFHEWPTPVVTSPFELGLQVCYPSSSVENDFGWAPAHPVVEAYKVYCHRDDRPMWDPTALLYAVEGEQWFTASPVGNITVTDEGLTLFEEDESGSRQFISADAVQASAVVDYLVKTVSAPPACRQ